jgi:Uma2 family endonuclease
VTNWVAKAQRRVRALERRTAPRSRGRLETPMGVPATKQTISDARRRYLDDPRPMEIHHGIARAVPRPMPEHNNTLHELFSALKGGVRSGTLTGWVFVADSDIDFQLDPEEVRAPDVAGYRRERWMPEWRRTVPIPQPPNWLCEIWSPGNSQQDREDLMRVSHDASTVEYVWTIDPALPALKVFRRGPTTWRRELVIDALDVVFEAQPFPGVALTPDALLE